MSVLLCFCNLKLLFFSVDGGFSDWSDFGGCSVTCGNGQQMRNRTCSNPKPSHGGKSCSGAFSETKSCNEKKCPGNHVLSKHWKM